MGLFHHSELNNFNLADDIIEPFRPVVDLQVASMGEGEELNPQNKSQLIGVLSHDVSLNGEKQPVSYAIEKVVQNLIRCFKGEADTLILPKLLPIEVHRYE